jgi:hypothetical protein
VARGERTEKVTVKVEKKVLIVTCDLTGKQLAKLVDGLPVECPEPCVEFTPHLYQDGQRMNAHETVAVSLVQFRELFGEELTRRLFPDVTYPPAPPQDRMT